MFWYEQTTTEIKEMLVCRSNSEINEKVIFSDQEADSEDMVANSED